MAQTQHGGCVWQSLAYDFLRILKRPQEASRAQGSLGSALSPREHVALIVEVRRTRQALYQAAHAASSCPRTRRFIGRVLAHSSWAAADDAVTSPIARSPLADTDARSPSRK
jgi:hypothetical protein